jgi:hypothetical protein
VRPGSQISCFGSLAFLFTRKGEAMMDVFQRFVQQNVDQVQTAKSERVVILPRELERSFEHYCRKRNLSFNEALVKLMEEACKSEQKGKKDQKKDEQEPDAALFMNDAL